MLTTPTRSHPPSRAHHGNPPSTPPNQTRYQFKMDRRVLSPVQLAAITRIYGEHGAEILELLRKNPCKTVPVILERLRQKDIEWRVVRCPAVYKRVALFSSVECCVALRCVASVSPLLCLDGG